MAWPPVYTSGRPRARAGVDADLLGHRPKRRGGRRQVTYNGHPLYYYVTDTRPGQITCQDVTEFGGTWLVVDPAGRRDPAAASPFPQSSAQQLLEPGRWGRICSALAGARGRPVNRWGKGDG